MEVDYLIAEDIKQIKLRNKDGTANEEILELLWKVDGVDNKHDYLMLTNSDYRYKHPKLNNNYKCDNCNSINISSIDGQKTCTDCGSVLGYDNLLTYNDMANYASHMYNFYKRKTYVKTIINNRLNDLSNANKEKIIKEAEKIFIEFNKKNLNKRKSFFSYSHMFRYILNKLKLYEYIHRFQPLKLTYTLEANQDFYNNL